MSNSFVYQQSSIDFVTTAAECCRLWEQSAQVEREEWIEQSLRLLSMLYLRARLCEPGEEMGDGYVQHFVTEDDYVQVQSGVMALLGTDDTYLEVMVEDFRYSDQPVTALISENIADIYQELRDLCASYQTAQEEVMNDALIACLDAYREHWGMKALCALRALHNLSLEPLND